jgi:hypothetical protein
VSKIAEEMMALMARDPGAEKDEEFGEIHNVSPVLSGLASRPGWRATGRIALMKQKKCVMLLTWCG